MPVLRFPGIAVLTAAGCLAGHLSTASCDPIVTFAEGKAPVRQWYVSPDGNDAAGNGSLAKPFRTIDRAVRETRAGDAVRLLPGTYDGGVYIRNLGGTAQQPIWLGGVPGRPRPLLQGGGEALHLARVRYLVLEDMEIARAASNGINCDDGGDLANPDATRHVLFRRLDFHDIGRGGNQDALKLSGVDDFFVLDCTFARTSAGGSAIDHVGCHHGLIARCTFADIGSNAIQCKGGSDNIEIRWNRFLQGGERAINIGGSTGFQFFRPPLTRHRPNAEARDIRVLANLFVGSDAPVAFVGTVQSWVANNTIIQPRHWVLRILQETTSTADYTFQPCGRNAFVNNLVYYERAQVRTPANIGPNTDAESFGFSHNLWYAFDQPARSQPSLPGPDTNSVVGVDPRLRDVVSGDYSPGAQSPAATNGVRWPGVTADLHERCFAAPPSIGAFQAAPTP